MAMLPGPDLKNKANFWDPLAASSVRFATFPEYLLPLSRESPLALLTSEDLHSPGCQWLLVMQRPHVPAQARIWR